MYQSKQMIVVRRDLKMRKGKIAAQAGHACVTAVLMALEHENRLSQVRTVGDGIRLELKIGRPASLSVMGRKLHGPSVNWRKKTDVRSSVPRRTLIR